jgi:hypothetical protein
MVSAKSRTGAASPVAPDGRRVASKLVTDEVAG